MAPDILKVAPKSTKVLFENERIRVLEMKFKKGQKVPMHSHPPNLVYSITDSKYKSISPGGTTMIVRFKKGEASFSPGVVHAAEAQTPMYFLQIDLK